MNYYGISFGKINMAQNTQEMYYHKMNYFKGEVSELPK